MVASQTSRVKSYGLSGPSLSPLVWDLFNLHKGCSVHILIHTDDCIPVGEIHSNADCFSLSLSVQLQLDVRVNSLDRLLQCLEFPTCKHSTFGLPGQSNLSF